MAMGSDDTLLTSWQDLSAASGRILMPFYNHIRPEVSTPSYKYYVHVHTLPKVYLAFAPLLVEFHKVFINVAFAVECNCCIVCVAFHDCYCMNQAGQQRQSRSLICTSEPL